LVLTGIVGLGTYLVYSTDAGSQALSWLGKKFEDLKNTASKSFGAIGTLLAKGDIGGAAKILWLTLKMEWLKGTSTLRAYWIGFKDSILATTTAITYGMARIISDGWAGIEVAWTETIGFLADAWSLFAGTLTKTWHSTIGFIKKAWVRLKSMFSDDVDVEAEVKRIDNETEAKNKSATDAMLADIGRRDQDRRARRQEIEQGREGREGALDQMRAAEDQQRRDQYNADLAAAQAELDDAKKQWHDAVDAANQPDAAADEPPSGDAPTPNTPPDLKDVLGSLGGSLSSVATGVETKGGFNAMALAGLGADSLTQRTAKATEEVASNTSMLVDQAKRGRLVFTD
jgi:hypothetical protein